VKGKRGKTLAGTARFGKKLISIITICDIICIKKVMIGYLEEGGAYNERYHEKMEPALEEWSQ